MTLRPPLMQSRDCHHRFDTTFELLINASHNISRHHDTVVHNFLVTTSLGCGEQHLFCIFHISWGSTMFSILCPTACVRRQMLFPTPT